MFFDKTLVLSEGQTITTGAAGTDGTNALVIEPAGDDYSRIWVSAIVKTAFTFGGTANPTGAQVKIAIETSDDKTFSTGVKELTSITIGSSADLLSLTKGVEAAFRFPLGTKKYVRCYFTPILTGGTAPTCSGRIDVALTDGVYTPHN